MKLGEALNKRADLQVRLRELQTRIEQNVTSQEGESPAEDPNDLLAEAADCADQLERLLGRINLTNAQTKLSDGLTITEAIARRDILTIRQTTIRTAINAASESRRRYSLTEIKTVKNVIVKNLQIYLDELSKQRRELDALLQENNWNIDLIE